MFRRSDFRNTRSVRKKKTSWQILSAVTNQMPMKCTPIQTVRKTKMGTLAMHRKKTYVHATMKNEALLGA
jgi:hypothetical protein